eukprot:scaffold18569_cov60-Cyclotella_meneghiniana.AAC.8
MPTWFLVRRLQLWKGACCGFRIRIPSKISSIKDLPRRRSLALPTKLLLDHVICSPFSLKIQDVRHASMPVDSSAAVQPFGQVYFYSLMKISDPIN